MGKMPQVQDLFSLKYSLVVQESNSYTKDHIYPNIETFHMSTIYNFCPWPIALHSIRRMRSGEYHESIQTYIWQQREVRQDSLFHQVEPQNEVSCSWFCA